MFKSNNIYSEKTLIKIEFNEKRYYVAGTIWWKKIWKNHFLETTHLPFVKIRFHSFGTNTFILCSVSSLLYLTQWRRTRVS